MGLAMERIINEKKLLSIYKPAMKTKNLEESNVSDTLQAPSSIPYLRPPMRSVSQVYWVTLIMPKSLNQQILWIAI